MSLTGTILFLILLESCGAPAAPAAAVAAVAPAKTNAMTLWMHYMPWFEGEYSLGQGNWGWHWKMNTMDPNIIDPATGERQIASHYYPLIGPYSSSDPAVVEYHALLMKYAGIDGVMIDWYGSSGKNDYGANLANSNAMIKMLKSVGLKFGVVYEDWTCGSSSTSTSIANAQADMAYLESNYFSTDEYIKLGGQDLFLVFGPRTFNAASDWSSILQGHASTMLVPLDNRMDGIGAKSEFDWPYQDSTYPASGYSHKHYLEAFNQTRAKSSVYPIASAYPGFNDFYAQGNAGSTLFFVDPYDGTADPCATLSYTLNSAKSAGLNYLQIATWNDFGEGTMIEPTVEFQFDFLASIQAFSGIEGVDASAFDVVYRLYKARKQFSGNAGQQSNLDQCFDDLCQLKVADAKAILDGLGVL
jgi:hypothetical protein